MFSTKPQQPPNTAPLRVIGACPHCDRHHTGSCPQLDASAGNPLPDLRLFTPVQIARIKVGGKARFEELEAQPAAAEARAMTDRQGAMACLAAVRRTKQRRSRFLGALVAVLAGLLLVGVLVAWGMG